MMQRKAWNMFHEHYWNPVLNTIIINMYRTIIAAYLYTGMMSRKSWNMFPQMDLLYSTGECI